MIPTPDDVMMPPPYHNGGGKRAQYVEPEQRPFIAWDGEGMMLSGDHKPQHYVLFGSSTGHSITASNLHVFDILNLVLEVGRLNPTAWHIGYAFSYDANMIVRELSTKTLARLHKTGLAYLRSPDGATYVIQFRKGKWLSISRREPQWDREKNPHAKQTVRIYDIFNFFNKSFIHAYQDLIGAVPDIIATGKAARKNFQWHEMEMVREYWSVETRMMAELATELRRRVYSANLRIRSWHGPGALSDYALKQHKVKNHMAVCPEPVQKASRYAYAGGRFELFKVGRIMGPIYSLDINSAYPYGISQLPSLTEGTWNHVIAPDRTARFGAYHVRLRHAVGFDHSPSPLFHRDDKHNISYPWLVEGWYWGPEVWRFKQTEKLEILEGWEYTGASSLPFDWVPDVYTTRQEWKSAGNAAEIALKLLLNSMYGKMAQRVGWEESGRIPPWHQLEWAGWVTANTRAMLYDVMRRIPWGDLIAVETDGIFTTTPPERLGIIPSKDLGGWGVEVYDEIMYVQSGLAWLRKGDTCKHADDIECGTTRDCKWSTKRRGLDADTFQIGQCESYLKSLQPNQTWGPYQGKTTRFIGLGSALNSGAPLKVRHCLWETAPREVSPSGHGKRVHFPPHCKACQSGRTAYEMPHDLVIHSLSTAGVMSTPHSIPWADKDSGSVEWREYEAKND